MKDCTIFNYTSQFTLPVLEDNILKHLEYEKLTQKRYIKDKDTEPFGYYYINPPFGENDNVMTVNRIMNKEENSYIVKEVRIWGRDEIIFETCLYSMLFNNELEYFRDTMGAMLFPGFLWKNFKSRLDQFLSLYFYNEEVN